MKKTLIMGVINVTPDSFYDGGRYSDADAARAWAAELLHDGADWLDVGGESTRPGSEPVGFDEEWRRLGEPLALIRELRANVSVDTYRAETARRALALGAAMINDVTAFRGDPAMAEVVAEAGCNYVLMHMRGDPRTMQDAPHYGDVVDDICAFFEERLRFAVAAGIREEQIWLDPGFGFGKGVAHNLEIVNRLGAFKRFGRPILVGPSNKATIGAVLDAPPDERTEGTAALVAMAIARGADAVRVHDVRAMARVARMCDAVMKGSAT